jgi:septum formation protein
VEHGQRADRELILASSSPRRRELLERIGIAIQVMPADVDETPRPGEPPAECALRLARTKAAAVADRGAGHWVLAADTIVEIDGALLGKASGADEATAMLRRLSGRTHRVVTAFALRGPAGEEIARQVVTEVDFRPLAPGEIAAYVRAGEWRDKAGAYAVQGMAAAFVSEVRGSITNVMGLPLAEVVAELAAAGAAAADFEGGEPA